MSPTELKDDEEKLNRLFQSYKRKFEARGNGIIELSEDKTEIIYFTKTYRTEVKRESVVILLFHQ
jgi:hypothetical protein